MIPPGFIQALLDYAEEQASAAELIAERDALFAKMASGGKAGKELIQTNLRTKQFQFEVSMTVEEKFSAYSTAIRLFNGTSTPMTYGAFPFLQR